MKRVYMGPNLMMAHMVEALLADNDIVAYVRGETLNFYSGATPVDGMGPAVYVANDEDCVRARDLIETFERARDSAAAEGDSWECPACGEKIEPQFTACWKCGAPAPE